MFVSIGEAMLELNYDPAHLESVIVGYGGDALNAAVMAARMGVDAALLGRIGSDATGRRLLAFCDTEGVRTNTTVLDDSAATGMYSGELGVDGAGRFDYHRTGSAGSRLGPQDVDELVIANAAVVHVTGITLAVSDTSAAAAERAVGLAHDYDVLVAVSVNHRPKLGGDVDRLREMTSSADLLFASADEAHCLFGTDDVADVRRWLGGERAEIVITHGSAGAVVGSGNLVIEQPALCLRDREVTGQLDTTGAGDAVTGVYVARRLLGDQPAEAIRWAVVAGGLACLERGATRSYPTRSEVERHLVRLAAGTTKEAV